MMDEHQEVTKSRALVVERYDTLKVSQFTYCLWYHGSLAEEDGLLRVFEHFHLLPFKQMCIQT